MKRVDHKVFQCFGNIGLILTSYERVSGAVGIDDLLFGEWDDWIFCHLPILHYNRWVGALSENDQSGSRLVFLGESRRLHGNFLNVSCLENANANQSH